MTADMPSSSRESSSGYLASRRATIRCNVDVDVDAKNIRTPESGALPIHEPGLLEVVQRNVAGGRLQFSTDIERAV